MLDDILPIWNMQDSAVIISQAFNNPRDLSRTNPLVCIFKFMLAS